MANLRTLSFCAASLFLLGIVTAHGGAHQKPLVVDKDADWATRHMAEEHHMSSFDAASFFTLHDYDANGIWDTTEILKTYGMDDPSAKDVPQDKKDTIMRDVLKMIDGDRSGGDGNRNGVIEKEEWMSFSERGGVLPDFGLGPGHHWDMETEYEIHHWEKYHDENTKEEDLTHPEDIAHFKLHDQLEDELERVAKLDQMTIVEANIPRKFRRGN